MPAPTSAISGAASRTVTVWPARRQEIAAPRPPRPAPTTTTWGNFVRWCYWLFGGLVRERGEGLETFSLHDSSRGCICLIGMGDMVGCRYWVYERRENRSRNKYWTLRY